jgi:zinc transport system ATP-binding protein
MTEALANLEGVTVQFDDRLVVNRVSLTVHRGDIITIIGPNGAGKTTLIKTVLGLQRATSGKVSRAPGLVTGYVPQHLTLGACAVSCCSAASRWQSARLRWPGPG